MKFNFKDFKLTSFYTPFASVMFWADFKSGAGIIGYADNDIHKPMQGEIPLFDVRKLRAECLKLYKKCVKISSKNTYSTEELITINDFFALTTFRAFVLEAPNTFEANSCDRTVKDGKEIVSRNYITFAVKVNEICKSTEMISTLTRADNNSFHNNIEMSVDFLMGKEINKFLSYVKTHSFDDMAIYIGKYDPKDNENCNI